jgi:hypothetical protein
MGNTTDMPIYLLAIRGTLKAPTLEAARKIHNETAGNPANVAAAKSLGDLSHMVYVPMGQPTNGGAGEFLILDVWNNLEGLNQFFANHQVQEQAGMIFESRDPVVWTPAKGFFNYHLPAPYGKNDRIVASVRGMLPSLETGERVHNEIVGSQVNAARMAGDMSHDAYLRLTPPGTPESCEFFAVDVWMSGEGMQKYYDNPEFLTGFSKLFAGQPTTSVWQQPAGDWVEW